MALPGSLERLIGLFAKFPGVGEKTARRMVFSMLGKNPDWARAMARTIIEVTEQVKSCAECGAITTDELCGVCADQSRDRSRICVVETQEDCVAMEQSGIYNGLYHVLGGKCSPLDGLEIPKESMELLRRRISCLPAGEVILALDPRIEGDLTAYTIQDALADMDVKISRLAYGLPVGGSIGYADRATLHVALESRREMEREDR